MKMLKRTLSLLLCLALAAFPLQAAPRGKSKASMPPTKSAREAPAGVSPQRQPPSRQSLGLDAFIGSVDLRATRVAEAVRLLAELSGVNVVATRAAAEREVSLYLRDTTARVLLDSLARVAGLWYRWRPDTRTWLVMTAEEYQRDGASLGTEETRVIRMRHHNVVAAANALRGLFGDRVRLAAPVEEALGEQIKTGDLRRGGTAATGAGVAAVATVGSEGNARAIRGGAAAGEAALADATQQKAALQLEAGAAASVVQAAREGKEAPLYVTYNKLHNLLMLRSGDDKALEQAERLVREMDLPARQVMLEMRIIEVRLDDEFHRAFDFDLFGGSDVVGTHSNQAVNPLTRAPAGRELTGALGNFDLFDRNSGVFQFINSRVRARLQLLEEKGRVHTLARPLLLASNNEPARLFIGEEVVLTTGATSQTTTGTTGATNTTITAETEKRDIGTTLVVHPRINADRTVTLTIDQESSARVAGGTTIPLAVGGAGNGQVLDFPIDTVNTSATQVVALAKDGLTIAVGGLIKVDRRKTEGGVPGLSAIPLLGDLFKSDERLDERSELVLLITPHVIETPEEGEAASRRHAEGRLDAEGYARMRDLGRASLPETAAPDVAPDADPVARYAALTRHAFLALSDPEAARRLNPGVQNVALDGADARAGAHLFQDPGLAVRPVAAWKDRGLFATALAVSNPDSARRALDSSRLNGRWLAATAERDWLEPRGRPNAGAHLVLLSDRPFAEALESGVSRP